MMLALETFDRLPAQLTARWNITEADCLTLAE